MSSTALFLRVKHEDQTAPCQDRQRTEIHRGFQAAPPTSVLVPLDDYSSVSLSVREPDSTVRARSFTTFSLPLHLQQRMSLLYLEIVEWKVALVQTTASAHSLNMDG